MSKKLEGKTALVTGASRGIGRATARRLADEGATVLVHYGNSPDAAEEAVQEIRAAGGKAFAVQADLADSNASSKLASGVQAALKANGLPQHVDILVNNAAVAEYSDIESTSEEKFDRLFTVNVRSLFFLTQKLLPLIPDGGRIVNVSSVVARAYFPNVLAYSATKGAVDVLTRHLAGSLGSRGITVNSVAPGAIDTDMSSGWLRNPEGQATVKQMQALQQVGKPEEIADAVSFLAGPDGRWVTGQILEASGGSKL